MAKSEWQTSYYNYMAGVAFLGYAWLIIAAIRILKQHSSKGVSIAAHFVLFAGSISYLTYGLLRSDPVLVIAGVTAMIFNLIVIYCIFHVNLIHPDKDASHNYRNQKQKNREENLL